MVFKSKNFCIVLSSPSGAGKTSISKKLIKKIVHWRYQFLAPQDLLEGRITKDYIFLNDEQFNNSIKKNKFLEFAKVFGYRYGTLKETINGFFKKKKDVLFDIDWQGYQQLKQSNFEVVGIFILPPSKKELVNRLKTRARDTKEEMKKRMKLVQNEISHFPEYEYVVINENIDNCVKQILHIIESERLKKSRLIDLTKFVNKFRI